MPSPRFHKLPPERQARIIAAARDEFLEHGFADASLNRVVERAGLSKGAVYYYFDSKEDLFTLVIQGIVTEFLEALGELPAVATAEEFWSATEDVIRHASSMCEGNEPVMKLSLAFLKEIGTGASGISAHALYADAMGWIMRMLRAGQQVGAIRTDLPLELLAALLAAVDHAVDLWMASTAETIDSSEIESHGRLVMSLVRRLLEPEVAPNEERQPTPGRRSRKAPRGHSISKGGK